MDQHGDVEGAVLMTHGETFRRKPGLLERLMVRGGLTEISLHIDTTMRGRRDGYTRATTEAELDGLRAEFGDLIRSARRGTGIHGSTRSPTKKRITTAGSRFGSSFASGSSTSRRPTRTAMACCRSTRWSPRTRVIFIPTRQHPHLRARDEGGGGPVSDQADPLPRPARLDPRRDHRDRGSRLEKPERCASGTSG